MSDNTIDNPVVALRNKDLDADTKILRKYELEDGSGRRLSYANEAIMDKLWKDQRAEFAAELRALEDATKPAGVDTTPTV